MFKNKIQKLISLISTLVLFGITLPCSAANIVPFNVGNVPVPPSAPITKTNTNFKNPSNSFSLQAMKSKIDEIINPQKGKAESRSCKCGDNLTCTFYGDDTVTISGTGKMYDRYVSGNCLWSGADCPIKNVIIEEGVTSIRDKAFWLCDDIDSVTIPSSVTYIGDEAFNDCTLTNVTILGPVQYIGPGAFGGHDSGCSELTSVTFNGTQSPDCDNIFDPCETEYPWSDYYKLNVTINVPCEYINDTFCGINVTKSCESSSSSSSSSSSEESSSSLFSSSSSSSSSDESSSKASSSMGVSSSSVQQSSTKQSSELNPVVSGAILGSKPAVWVAATVACIVPAAAMLFSYLM